MHKFIKTFYLWLALFTFCNVVSLVAMHTRHPWPENGVFLYPLAWLLQLPLVLSLAAAHQGINRLFTFLPTKWKKPVRFSLCALCAFFFMGMYAASQMMFQQIEAFISWDTYRVAWSNAAQLFPDIAGEMAGELLLIGAFSIVISLLYTRRYHNNSFSHSPLIFTLLIAVFITSGAGGFVAVYKMAEENALQIRQKLLPTTYLTFSIIDNLLPSASPSADFLKNLVLEDRITMDQYFQSLQNPVEEKPHVFFIMLESVSWDRYGFTGYHREDITPNLDQLALESVVFTRSYAAAPHSNYAQTSTHASQYPLRRKKLDQFENVNYPKTLLLDVLGHAGYQTAFFSAQNEEWQGMKKFIFSGSTLQHFFHSIDELGEDIGIETKLTDETVRSRAIEYLDTLDHSKPVYMYLNLQATHFPYDVPEGFEQPYEPHQAEGFEYSFFNYDQAHLDTVINKFDNALRYVDAQIGAFIDHLKTLGLYDNSLIIVTSDHGEAFYKRGYPTHGTSLFEDQMRTMTLFKIPMSGKMGTRTDPISLIDINPTVLEILGMKNHPNFQGQQVLNGEREGSIYLTSHGIIKSHGILDYPWKYITSERDGEWLLNIEKDPSEWTDFSEQNPEMLKKLKEELRLFQTRQLYYYNVLPQEERDRLYPPQHRD